MCKCLFYIPIIIVILRGTGSEKKNTTNLLLLLLYSNYFRLRMRTHSVYGAAAAAAVAVIYFITFLLGNIRCPFFHILFSSVQFSDSVYVIIDNKLLAEGRMHETKFMRCRRRRRRRSVYVCHPAMTIIVGDKRC